MEFINELPVGDQVSIGQDFWPTAEELAVINYRLPLAEAQDELNSLPTLAPKRIAWLNRHGITHDDGVNKIYELPPLHRFTEIDEPTLAIPIFDKQGEMIDFVWFAPRYPRTRARLCGKAVFINEAAITAREYSRARPLHVWWHALNWLKAGRIGIVILNPFEADALSAVPALCAESFEHGESAFDWPWCGHGSRVLVPKRIEL